jgi:hypothetical protein
VPVVPERCRHCRQPFPEPVGRRQGRVWRHQVVEVLPLAVQVTEYQMAVRRCSACGKRTRAALPAGVPRRPFGPRLTAVVALLSGRYRLSRREVRQLLQDLWQVRMSLGAVVRQEQVQSAALAAVIERSPGRGAAGSGCEYGRDRLATGAAAGLAVDGSDRRVDRVSDRPEPGRGRGRGAPGSRAYGGGRVGPVVGLQPAPRGAASALPGAPQTALPGPGGPRWRSGTDRALRAGRSRAAICALACATRMGGARTGVRPSEGPQRSTATEVHRHQGA